MPDPLTFVVHRLGSQIRPCNVTARHRAPGGQFHLAQGWDLWVPTYLWEVHNNDPWVHVVHQEDSMALIMELPGFQCHPVAKPSDQIGLFGPDRGWCKVGGVRLVHKGQKRPPKGL